MTTICIKFTPFFSLTLILLLLLFLLTFSSPLVSASTDDDHKQKSYSTSTSNPANTDDDQLVIYDDNDNAGDNDNDMENNIPGLDPDKSNSKTAKSTSNSKSKSKSTSTKSTRDLSMGAYFAEWAKTDDNYSGKMEIAISCLCLLYLLAFAAGALANHRLRNACMDAILPELQAQFSKVAVDADGSTISQESFGSYVMYATGRKNTTGVTVFLDLRKRYDLFFFVHAGLLKTKPDLVTFLIPIIGNVQIEPMVFCFAAKRDVRTLVQARADLANFSEQVTDSLLQNYAVNTRKSTVLTDNTELLSLLLTSPVQQFLRDYPTGLELLHVTDSGVPNIQSRGVKNMIELSVAIPSHITGDHIKLKEFLTSVTRMALMYLDLVPKVKLPPAAKDHALKLRALKRSEEDKVKEKERQEEVQRKMDEKRQEIMAKGGETQRKYEEKMKRKADKKKMASGIRIIK